MLKTLYYILCTDWDDEDGMFHTVIYMQDFDMFALRNIYDAMQPDELTPLIEFYHQGETCDERLAYKKYAREM